MTAPRLTSERVREMLACACRATENDPAHMHTTLQNETLASLCRGWLARAEVSEQSVIRLKEALVRALAGLEMQAEIREDVAAIRAVLSETDKKGGE